MTQRTLFWAGTIILSVFAVGALVSLLKMPSYLDDRVASQHTQQNAAARSTGEQDAFQQLVARYGSDDEPIRLPIEKPCYNGEKDRSSDLCAQWFAAQAASDSAQAGQNQVTAAWIGAILIFISLLYAHHATSLAGRAIGKSAEANSIAAEGLRLLDTDLKERFRPRCAIVAVDLGEGWCANLHAGSPLPVRITVQNAGGGTGRLFALKFDRIAVLDRHGQVLGAMQETLFLAPLRAGQIRVEGMLLKPTGKMPAAHSIEISGRIASMDDQIEGLVGKLDGQEMFFWTDNPLNRSSPELVERLPNGHQPYSASQAGALPQLGTSQGIP